MSVYNQLSSLEHIESISLFKNNYVCSRKCMRQGACIITERNGLVALTEMKNESVFMPVL